uniref:Paraoxonase n=1 Tax=Acrobeloides nanus TaxID=290746 RepID=A0A914EMK4_9BILA
MEFVEELGLVFISHGGFKRTFGFPISGKILVYKFSDENKACDSEPIELKILASNNTFLLNTFTPLGISAHVSNKRTTLYVVNAANQSVEIFSYNIKDNTLLHLQTIKDQVFTSLSDIAVVSAGKFFVTNMFYSNRKWTQLAEMLMHLHIGSLIFYDGKKAEILEKGLLTPNGLAIDRERSFLYVGSFLGETIKSFKLERDLSLRPMNEMAIMSSVDQIYVDNKTGDLWLAAHPIFSKTISHFYNQKLPSPSHVLHLRFHDGHSSWTITEPFANDGQSGISAVASVVEFGNQMIIGSRLGKTICCQINAKNLV